jgi:hypothetical protein
MPESMDEWLRREGREKRELRAKGLHRHWMVVEKGWQENIPHSLSLKHQDIYSFQRHASATGAFQRWATMKGLYLLDSTYERYQREVLRKKLGLLR